MWRRSCLNGNWEGCRVTALTPWPRFSASSTKIRPVAPFAPNTEIFTAQPRAFYETYLPGPSVGLDNDDPTFEKASHVAEREKAG